MPRRTKITFKPIKLRWSEWHTWAQIKREARSTGGVNIPSRPGVYEVMKRRTLRRLTIGKTINLRRRIRSDLVRGTGGHSAGKSIRAHEDVNRVLTRWAPTSKPAAVEEELHRRHKLKHGALPKYTKLT